MQENQLYAIVMGMDDATLNRLRQWLKRVARPLTTESDERSRVAARAREWRDQRRGGWEWSTNWSVSRASGLVSVSAPVRSQASTPRGTAPTAVR